MNRDKSNGLNENQPKRNEVNVRIVDQETPYEITRTLRILARHGWKRRAFREHRASWAHPLFILLALASPASAALDCTLPGSGLPPAPYVRSAAHEARGVLAAQGITLSTAGKVGFMVNGQSIGSGISPGLKTLIARSFDLVPSHVYVHAAYANKSTEYWADPNDTAWQSALNATAQAGLSPRDVQVAVMFVSPMKQLDIPTPVWRFRAIADNYRRYFPNLRLLQFVTVNGTAYSTDAKARNIHSTVRQDAWTLAGLVEDAGFWPAGLWAGFLDLWADGATPNPYAVSHSFPEGIWWRCSDSAVDGVHQTTRGSNRSAWSVYERIVGDPVFRGWLFRE